MVRRFQSPARMHVPLVLFMLAALVFAPATWVLAETQGQVPREYLLQPDGVVDITTLPPPVPGNPNSRVRLPRLHPDPDTFHKHKAHEARGQVAVQPPQTPSAFTSITSFSGLNEGQSGGFYPPDTQVAAGPNHLFEVVNVEGQILTKTGGLVNPPATNPFDLNTFFGLPMTAFLTDPKIRFDPLSERWFVLAATLESPAGTWRLAVSTSSDPTGTYVRYRFPSASKTFPDFPALGISDDKVVVTANAFGLTNGSFKGTEFWVLNKAQLLSGGGVTGTFFGPPQGLFTIQPAHSLSSTTTLFMASVQFGTANSIGLWSVTGVPGVGGGVSRTTVSRALATGLSIPPDAQQLGSSNLIATNDNRLLDAVYRDGFLWVAANAACAPSGDTRTRACLRFIQIKTSTLTVNQDITFGTVGTHYYYAAIQIDVSKNLIAVFSRSSSSEYASVYASGRKASDATNTLQAPALVKAGEASYADDRWGDYSGAGIDPSGQTLVWVAGEYAQAGQWGTWIARLGF